YGLTRALFDRRIAWLAILMYVLLPLPAAIGHETLSDSLALFAALFALALGEAALRTERWRFALGCGMVGGIGYLARPEVLIVPVAVVLTWASYRRVTVANPAALPRFAAMAVCAFGLVGMYALVKGEVSEKLALRLGASM